ncbi:hypothetical protein F8M41_025538 [Gigaspora margarita]|uniref:F-box domain-containing protein n=1 Tax=Gigaspora margarita TaxID=4874 RepID=A0A8H3XJZ3_GIGMA|nr:hypothetical protein F8M41_025538 [Gigaspora margarita]
MASELLPEILEKTLNNLYDFNGDFNEIDTCSLRSCTLVNWHWCKVTTPILWRDTFLCIKDVCVPVYLSFLGEDEKIKLRECGITIDHYPEALFNYPSFLKHLDIDRLLDTVHVYVNPPEKNIKETMDDLTLSSLTTLNNINLSEIDFNDVTTLNNLTNLLNNVRQHTNPPIREMNENMKDTANKLANLLLKIFIENGATLIKLNIITSISGFPPIQSEIFHSLEQNGQFFSHLQEVFLYTDSGKFSNDLIMLLRSLVKVSTNIHTLKLRETHRYGRSTINYDPQTLDVLAVLIRSQRKLRKLDISYEKSFKGVISALKSQENSLQELILSGQYIPEYMVLKDCETLEVLRIKDRDAIPILKQLADGLCKLSTLDIGDGKLTSSDIIPLIRNSGQILQRLRLVPSDENIPSQSLLWKTLIEYCPNLIYFCICCVELSNQFVEFIEGLQ